MRAVWGVTTVGVGGAAALTLGTEPAIAADGTLTAKDVDVTSNGGELTTLTVAPSVTVDWTGQESQVATVRMTWHAESVSSPLNSGTLTTVDQSVSTPAVEGSASKTFTELSLLSGNGGPLTASNFASDTDGQSNSRDVKLTMDVTLLDGSDNEIMAKDGVLTATYTVTVTNENSTVTATGTANTNGS